MYHNIKPVPALFILLLLLSATAAAQKMYISGDTILISATARPTIMFPAQVQSYQLSYPNDYSIMELGNSVMLRTASGTPNRECLLNIWEGKSSKKSNQRMHSFLILFMDDDRAIRGNSLIHDYSDMDVMQNRMRELSLLKQGRTLVQQPAPSAPPVTTHGETLQQAQQIVQSRRGEVTAPAPVQHTTASTPERRMPEKIIIDGKELTNEEIQAKASENIRKFNAVIKYLCQPHTPKEYETGIKRGLSFFVSDTCIVEVSSLKSDSIKKRRIPAYLQNLADNRYKNVNIDIGNLFFISKLIPNPDGTYRGQVQFMQTFTTSAADGRIIYSDRTEKILEIVLVKYVTQVEDTLVTSWDIKLSNIHVIQTLG